VGGRHLFDPRYPETVLFAEVDGFLGARVGVTGGARARIDDEHLPPIIQFSY
jgi:hypothetical protein